MRDVVAAHWYICTGKKKGDARSSSIRRGDRKKSGRGQTVKDHIWVGDKYNIISSASGGTEVVQYRNY